MSLINQKDINELVSLYKNKSFEELLKKSEILLIDNPKDYFVNNISGMAYINLSNFQKTLNKTYIYLYLTIYVSHHLSFH